MGEAEVEELRVTCRVLREERRDDAKGDAKKCGDWDGDGIEMVRD